MSVSIPGRITSNVVHNSHKVVFGKHMSVSILGRNPTHVKPVAHIFQQVGDLIETSLSTPGRNCSNVVHSANLRSRNLINVKCTD